MMKRTAYAAMFAVVLLAASCEQEMPVEEDFLTVETTEISGLSGEGEAFGIVVSSNVEWTASTDADWIILENVSGKGSAVVDCFAKRAERTEGRSCTITLASEKFVANVSVSQGKFEPVIYHFTVSEVMAVGMALEDGASVAMTDFSMLAAVVASDASGNNAPEGYVVLTDNGSDYLRYSASETYALGSILDIDMTGSTLTKLGEGNYLLSAGTSAEVAEGSFTFDPITVSIDRLASFENCYVKVEGCQACDDFVGKKWAGEVDFQMVKNFETIGGVYTSASASWANSDVVDMQGYVAGLVCDGKLRPRTAEDISLTEKRASPPEKVMKPILGLIHSTESKKSDNITIGTNEITFSEMEDFSTAGAKIQWVDGPKTMTYGNGLIGGAYVNNYVTTVNWVKGASIIYSAPVSEPLKGNIEFVFNVSCGTKNCMKDFELNWSTDGVNYKPVDALWSRSCPTGDVAIGNNIVNISDFTAYQLYVSVAQISFEEETSVDKLYFKLTHTADATALSKTLRMNYGFYICQGVRNTEFTSPNVLASENFASCEWFSQPVMGMPLGMYAYPQTADVPVTYSSTSGWTVTGDTYVRRGCLFFNSYANNDSFLTSPALSGLTSETDVKLSCLVAPYVASNLALDNVTLTVSVSGPGVVEDVKLSQALDEDIYNWHELTAIIRGATADTRVNIGVMNQSVNSRFYLDDVVISR